MKTNNLKNGNLLIDKNHKEPIIIVYDLKQKNNLKLKITIEENIKVSIIELFVNALEENNYDFKREFLAKENSSLTYLKYQDIASKATLNFDFVLDLKKNSNLQITNLELGKVNNENSYISKLKDENVRLQIAGLVKIEDKTLSSSRFDITHIAQNCSSDIKYKHSLNGNAKAIFQAKSIVEEKANFSKVFQNTDTILLSEDAVIFAQPHLEINIDELEASHGATTGTIDEEQLLYLQARGIKKELAKEILSKAFENEIYDNISDNKIKNFLANFKKDDYV